MSVPGFVNGLAPGTQGSMPRPHHETARQLAVGWTETHGSTTVVRLRSVQLVPGKLGEPNMLSLLLRPQTGEPILCGDALTIGQLEKSRIPKGGDL